MATNHVSKQDWLTFLLFMAILFFGMIAENVFGQNADPWAGHIVRKDTVVSNSVNVIEYTNKNGKLDYKAKWSGKSLNISDKDANAILEGDDAAIILVTYNIEGREIVLPKKIIARKLRNNQ